MDVITAIAVFVLVTIVFGSSQIVDLILKKRREKKGEDIIQEPWQQMIRETSPPFTRSRESRT